MSWTKRWARWLRRPSHEKPPHAPWFGKGDGEEDGPTSAELFWKAAKEERPSDADIVTSAFAGRRPIDLPHDSIGAGCFDRFDRRYEGWLGAARKITQGERLEVPETAPPNLPIWMGEQVFWTWGSSAFADDARIIEGARMLGADPLLLPRSKLAAKRMQRRWDGWTWAVTRLQGHDAG